MKTVFLVLLGLGILYCTAGEATDNEIERLEEAIREFEHVKREGPKESKRDNRGVFESVEGDMLQEPKRLSYRTHDREDARNQLINQRRASLSGTGGQSYNVDTLQRTSSQVLHRNNNKHNNKNERKGNTEKRQTSSCYAERVCDASDKTYRSADGSCNNLANPNWGKAGIPLTRWTTNRYEDNESLPRSTGTDKASLPLARKVSTKVHRDDTVGNFTVSSLTHMVMQWGQFLAHDCVSTPTQTDDMCVFLRSFRDKGLFYPIPHPNVHSARREATRPQCLAIKIPDGDRHFQTRKCMGFVRSLQADPLDCVSVHKEQLNAITSFIDASNVYGSSADYMKSLRAANGMLLTSANDLLPHDADTLNCVVDSVDDVCFKAGDLRVNVAPGLASMHTLFVRQHNKIASYLTTNNPSWDSDKTFYETRKIIGALMQHITYSEWLPVILGDEVSNYHIEPTATGFNTSYDAAVDPRVATEYATAAGRFGHSMIQTTMTRSFGTFNEETDISAMFGRTKYVTEENGDGLNRIVTGLITNRPERTDDWYSTQVSDRLFESVNEDSLDIAALNIQRGRDHGLPTYNDMRTFCGLSTANQFDIAADGFINHRSGIATRFAELYASTDDVDLYSGGVSESRVSGGQVGPLFACMNGKQFEALKKGDRFWYENEFSDSGFTLDQLNAIKKVKFSRIICDNTGITTIPQNAFMQELGRNKMASCSGDSNLPEFDLSPWIE